MHWIIWLVLFAIFVIVELSTVQLVSIWFALGCLGAGITSFLTDGENVLWEFGVFAIVTAISLLATRPFVKKLTKNNTVPTNADAAIGETAVVTEEINNLTSTGAVSLKGVTWTARTDGDDSSIIPVDSKVEVLRIDGVKLIVKIKL